MIFRKRKCCRIVVMLITLPLGILKFHDNLYSACILVSRFHTLVCVKSPFIWCLFNVTLVFFVFVKRKGNTPWIVGVLSVELTLLEWKSWTSWHSIAIVGYQSFPSRIQSAEFQSLAKCMLWVHFQGCIIKSHDDCVFVLFVFILGLSHFYFWYRYRFGDKDLVWN